MTVRRTAPEVRVFFNGVLQPDAQCLEVTLASGAHVLPRAVLRIQPPTRDAGRPELRDRQLAALAQSRVDVVQGTQWSHWGTIVAGPTALDGHAGDELIFLSRMDPHHFGNPLAETYFWDAAGARPLPLPLPMVFNPEWDGRTSGNRSPHKHRVWGAHLFSHPGQLESLPALAYNGIPPVNHYWSLRQAVHTLCWSLNPRQLFLRNPTLADLAAVPDDPSLLRNHVCPPGRYLPEQLDLLLAPFGIGWTVAFTAGSRFLRFFARGSGSPRSLKLQPFGERLNMNESNLEEARLAVDVAHRSFNAVAIYGEHVLVEATFELVPGWSAEYDDLEDADLAKNAAAWLEHPDYTDVWRKWVLNEAGDYNGSRPAVKKPYNLVPILGRSIARRRKLHPCLSLNADGTPRGHAGGVYVEYLHGATSTEEGTWFPIDDLSAEGKQVRILQRECGIYFDGLVPPAEIRDQGTRAKVRVTATIAADARAELRLTAASSLLKDYKQEILNVGSRFKIRRRHVTSRFHGEPGTVSSCDDTPAMATLASSLLTSWNLATLDGTVTLTGVDYLFANLIGTTLSGIAGRDVSFNVAPPGAAPRYPTVVGALLDFVGQRTVLTLDTYRAAPRSFV